MADSKEYLAGYDAGMNGANMKNCHFSLFATKEQTKEWERGNADGSYARDKLPRGSHERFLHRYVKGE